MPDKRENCLRPGMWGRCGGAGRETTGDVGERLGLKHDTNGQGWRAALGSHSAAAQSDGIYFTEGVFIQVRGEEKEGVLLGGRAKKNAQMLGVPRRSGRGEIDTWLKLHVLRGTHPLLESFSLCDAARPRVRSPRRQENDENQTNLSGEPIGRAS
jgi:hypothetical protein